MASRSAGLESNGRNTTADPNPPDGSSDGRLESDPVPAAADSGGSGRADRPARVRAQRKPPRERTPLRERLDVLKDVVSAGLYPLGSEDDPAWTADPDAMEFLTARTLDGHTKREVPMIRWRAIPGGWTATVVDVSIGYQCEVRFTHIDEFFESFSEQWRDSRNWKEIDYGEFAQERKRSRKKRADEEVKK